MNRAISQQARAIRRLAHTVGQVIAECNDATRRMSTLAGTPDRFPDDPDRAPDTYAEFVIRTGGLARREPQRSGRRGIGTR
jgi:hypothetical protein